MSNIPASEIVSVTPGVLGVGGTALNLSGLLLTTSTRPPIGTVPSFATADDVGDYFGPSSAEKTQADIYFAGFDGSNVKPGAMLFAQYPTSPVAAYLRGSSLAAMTLAQLQAIKPASITASIGGSVTASGGAAFTATGAGTNMTASAVTGLISVGDLISGTGVPANTFIVSQTSGTPGGAGVYVTSQATTSSGDSITGTSTVLDVTAVGDGSVQTGDVISGTGVTANTTITGQLTGSAGSTGTYRMSGAAQEFASTTVTVVSAVLDVTVVASGTVAPNLLLSGSGVTSGTRVVAQLSGTTGGVGLYSLSLTSSDVASEAITGAYDMSVTVNGTPATSASVNLSAATSFSAAAITIGSAIGETVTFDSVTSAFTIASPTTGAASTIGFGSGALASALNLTSVLGAVTSQGANAATPGPFMDGIAAATQNWASFATLFDPDNSGNANKQLFAAWTNTKAPRYVYCAWDTDVTPTQSSAATSSLGYILKHADSSGTIVIYNSVNIASFAMSIAASLDFSETNGRATYAFRKQTGLSGVTAALAATVTDATSAQNLMANGYNFYGDYATANDDFDFFYPGSISGPFKWADTYVNQIWMTNSFQLALMELLTQVKSIPYNAAGQALIQAGLGEPITAAVNFGAVESGVTLSAAQASEVNQAAGVKIDGVLSTRGWYLQVKTATPSARAARTSPPCSFWYTDGGSVQQINLASVTIQ